MSNLLHLAVLALPLQDSADSSLDSRGNRLVKLELLADRGSIRPGETFSLGVRFRVEPQWHIYWENYGDTGFPTRARITGPEGFEIGELRFPGPERHVAEGEIVSYVHHGEVVLLADVRAPKELAGAPSSAAFQVEARWLVCMEACFTGSGEARIDLPIAASAAAGNAQPAPANEKLFAEARARLPRPWSELQGASIEWRGTADEPIAVVAVPGASELEFFPLTSETTNLLARETAREGGTCRLSATLEFRKSGAEDAARLQGVLRVRKEKSEVFYRMNSTPGRSASQARPK